MLRRSCLSATDTSGVLGVEWRTGSLMPKPPFLMEACARFGSFPPRHFLRELCSDWAQRRRLSGSTVRARLLVQHQPRPKRWTGKGGSGDWRRAVQLFLDIAGAEVRGAQKSRAHVMSDRPSCWGLKVCDLFKASVVQGSPENTRRAVDRREQHVTFAHARPRQHERSRRVYAGILVHKTEFHNTWSQLLWLPKANNFERVRMDQSLNNKAQKEIGCQGGLTVTSASDLGVVCHVGLFLLHAVIAKGGGTSQQAHACTRFLRSFPSFNTVDDS